MIGVDTNVLVRYFVTDEPVQHELVCKFMADRTKADPAFVSIPVLLEFYWVVTRIYGVDREAVTDLLELLLSSPEIIIENAGLVRAALVEQRASQAGLLDVLVALSALSAGCASTITFDKKAAGRITGMELLT